MPKTSKRFVNIIGNLLLIVGFLLLAAAYGPIVYDEAWYWLKTQKNQSIEINAPESQSVQDSPFARLLSSKLINIDPVNKDFSVVIEKIGVNAPINKDVAVTNKQAYNEALKTGIAHASVSEYPSERAGNVYLFAHSSLNFWELGKYAKTFNLLRKLELGDKVHVFYEGKDYVYEVMNKETYNGWNTYPLERASIEPILTLQTCDPPGTTLNRLVVTAKLKEINELEK